MCNVDNIIMYINNVKEETYTDDYTIIYLLLNKPKSNFAIVRR